MSEGQSLYLILTAFYLLECIKLAPIDSIAFVGRINRLKARSPLMIAWGLGKSVIIAPFLPWPFHTFIISGFSQKEIESKPIQSSRNIKRMHRLLLRATSRLRWLSIAMGLWFFALLPILYVYFYNEALILSALGLCYVGMIGTALHFRKIHQRLFPHAKAERLKLTLYNAFLPWQIARSCDELFLKSSLRWNPLSALAAYIEIPENKAILMRLYREARYRPQPSFTLDFIQSHLKSNGIETDDWLKPPQDITQGKFCPSCQGEYEKHATYCHDCNHTPLHKSGY